MDRARQFIEYMGRVFLSGITQGSFLSGFLLTFWPAVFFFLYGLSIPLGATEAGVILSKTLNFFSALPLILVFYEAALICVGAGIMLFSENRKFGIGMLYGVALTFVLLITLAVLFSFGSLLQFKAS